MNTPDPKNQTANPARNCLKGLYEKFDVLRSHVPLAIGIDKQLLADDPGLDRKVLRQAMRLHTTSTRYLKEMEKATVRFGLDGKPADEVTEEQRLYASATLRERFRKAGEQKREAAAAQLAEQKRLEKLNQLAAKFGRQAR